MAAFLVVWHHASLVWFSWRIHNGWGSSPEDHLFIQWPFIRLLIAGPPQVMVFFVISGYALSYKPLKLARQGRRAEFADTLASSVFRRHSRLFLPLIVITFAGALATQFGFYGTEGWGGVAVPTRQPPRPDNMSAQLADWWAHVIHLIDPVSKDMNRGGNFPYDPNMWTLPTEFDGSLFIFLCLAAFSRVRPLVRLLFTFAIVLYSIHFMFWQIFLFVSGMFICDLQFYLADWHADTPVLPALESPAPRFYDGAVPSALNVFRHWRLPQSPRLWQVIWTSSFMAALWVLGIPENHRGGPVTPGYSFLFDIMPTSYRTHLPDNFWLPVGAVWLVFTVDRAPWLQRIFAKPFPQYLGKISYSLYLVHGPILWTWGRWLARACVRSIGHETDTQWFWGIALSACIFWPTLIWSADLTCRWLDTKAVDFGRWVYERLAMKESAAEEK